MATWYYVGANREPVGPLSEEGFETAIQQGQITPSTSVWNETMTEWKALNLVRPPVVAVPVPQVESPEPAASTAEGGLKMAVSPRVEEPVKPVDYGRAEASPERHVCVECKDEFPATIMSPFGAQWICRLCRAKAVEKAKERGFRQSMMGSDMVANLKRLAFVLFCLVFGTSVIMARYPGLENYFKARSAAKRNRLGLLANLKIQEMEKPPISVGGGPLFLVARTGTAPSPWKEAQFILVIHDKQMRVIGMVPGVHTAPLTLPEEGLRLVGWDDPKVVVHLTTLQSTSPQYSGGQLVFGTPEQLGFPPLGSFILTEETDPEPRIVELDLAKREAFVGPVELPEPSSTPLTKVVDSTSEEMPFGSLVVGKPPTLLGIVVEPGKSEGKEPSISQMVPVSELRGKL